MDTEVLGVVWGLSTAEVSEHFVLEESAPNSSVLTGRGVVAGGGPPEDDFILAEVVLETASATRAAYLLGSW